MCGCSFVTFSTAPLQLNLIIKSSTLIFFSGLKGYFQEIQNKSSPSKVQLMNSDTEHPPSSNHWLNILNKRAKRAPSALLLLPSEAEAGGHFCPASSAAWKILLTLLTIVRATLLSQSKDQNSSHVSREQMSYHLGWCEHRYNADRKPKQSLVEPIMGWAVGAGLQTPLFLCRTTPRCMINFLANSTQAARSLPSL